MYFLTPRKCAIFGICCEAGRINTLFMINTLMACKYHSFQVKYLIDEAVNTGKGANNIISMLHHFLQTHNLGKACSGQNKNQLVMQYLSWRVLVGLNDTIMLFLKS